MPTSIETTAEIIRFPAVLKATEEAIKTPQNTIHPVIRSEIDHNSGVDGQDSAYSTGDSPADSNAAKLQRAIRAAELRVTQFAARAEQQDGKMVDAGESLQTLAGAILLIQHLAPGEPIKVWELIKKCKNNKVSQNTLYYKSKLLLENAGIWKKIGSKEYRWVDWKPTKNAETHSQFAEKTANDLQIAANGLQIDCESTANRLQMWLDNWRLKRAARDPYCTVTKDENGKPVIKKMRKPFTGELTETEKKAIRDRDEQAKYAKLLVGKAVVSPEAVELAKRLQAEAMQRKADQAAQLDTIILWVKIIALIGGLVFLASTVGTGSPANELPQGIMQ